MGLFFSVALGWLGQPWVCHQLKRLASVRIWSMPTHLNLKWIIDAGIIAPDRCGRCLGGPPIAVLDGELWLCANCTESVRYGCAPRDFTHLLGDA